MAMSATNFGDPNHIIRIPARELTGTREAKLAELDTLLAQLQLVRLVLCGQPIRLEGVIEAPGSRSHHRIGHVWARSVTRLQAIFKARTTGASRTQGDRP
jgi:hypothetical protein